MSTPSRQFRNMRIIFAVVVVVMVIKYFTDQAEQSTPQLTTDAFSALEKTMRNRIAGVPDSVKRRVNISENTFDYVPHQASYRAVMHLNELYTGNAIHTSSRDCDNWYEEYSVQLKSDEIDNAVFDYRASRLESISGHQAEITTNISSWFRGQRDATEEKLRFKRISGALELKSNGETVTLDYDTKLNIQSSRYILQQIEQQNYTLEYWSEPDDFSEYAIQNRVTIEAFEGEANLDQLWLVKTEEYKDRGEGYELSATTLELVNDRAITLYAATQGDDGLLYELILNDFEYLTSRCIKMVSL